jgi:hypothetical protein
MSHHYSLQFDGVYTELRVRVFDVDVDVTLNVRKQI